MYMLEASATYNPESGYLEVTVAYGDEESLRPNEISSLTVIPKNQKGYNLAPVFALDGNYGNSDGTVKYNFSRIERPHVVDVILVNKDSVEFKTQAYPDIEQKTEISARVYSEQLEDDPQNTLRDALADQALNGQ